MKRLFLALTGCLFAIAASAQTLHEGSIFINPALTNLGYNSFNVKIEGEKTSSSQLGLQATGGYVLQDDFAIMAGIGYQNVSHEDSGMGLFNISAGARKYFIPGVYAGANLVLGTLSIKNNEKNIREDDDDEEEYSTGGSDKGHTFGIELNAGYTYYLSKNFAVEPSVSFYYGLSSEVMDHKVDISIFSINIGFIYKLDDLFAPKKKASGRKK